MIRLAALAIAVLLATPAAPETDSGEIVCGCSGGITGGGEGLIVTRAGRISRWQQDRAGVAKRESFVCKDVKAAQSLFTELETMRFEAIDFNKPGNMTCFVTRRIGAQSHTVAWSAGDTAAPKEVIELYRRMRNLEKDEPAE